MEKIIHKIKRQKILIFPAISAFLLYLSFEVQMFWILGFFALIPLFYFLYALKTSPKHSFWGSFLFGALYMGGITFFFWSTFPLDWAGITNSQTAFFLILYSWLISTLILALPFGFFGLLFHKLKTGNVQDIFLGSFLWIIFEFLRSIWFYVFWIGQGAILGPHWTLGAVGYIIAESPLLLSLAGFGGLYLLSFLIVLVNIVLLKLYLAKRKKDPRKLVNLIAPCVFLLGLAFGIYIYDPNRSESTLEVALITTNIPSSFEISEEDHLVNQSKHIELLMELKRNELEPDVVIFPEGSRFMQSLKQTDRRLLFESDAGIGKKNKLIIDSADDIYQNSDRKFNLYYYNTGKLDDPQYEAKRFLTTHGEYLPYLTKFIMKATGASEWLEQFQQNRSYLQGNKVSFGEVHGVTISALFCVEVFSPSLYRRAGQADIIANVSSHAVFGGNQSILNQTLKASKVRAVENDRYFVQAGNQAPSFIINNKGQLLNMTTKADPQVLYGKIPAIQTRSFYNKTGDWVLIIALFSISYAIFRKYNSSKMNKF